MPCNRFIPSVFRQSRIKTLPRLCRNNHVLSLHTYNNQLKRNQLCINQLHSNQKTRSQLYSNKLCSGSKRWWSGLHQHSLRVAPRSPDICASRAILELCSNGSVT